MKRKAKQHGLITANLLAHLGRQYGKLMSDSAKVSDHRAFEIYRAIANGYFVASQAAEKHDKKKAVIA